MMSWCYKNPANPSCIDLILTTLPRSFQNSSVLETGLSDFHKMIVTVLKTTFQRLPPKIRNYRDYSYFDHGMFRTCLCNNLSKEDAGNLEKFIKVCINKLNNQVPSKKKYTRGNHLPFMNKELSKAIMNKAKECLLDEKIRWKQKKVFQAAELLCFVIKKN